MHIKFFSSRISIFVVIVLYVFIIQFFVSLDSYTHDLYGRCDDAWYFMGGKSLVNGLKPYIDFTDVKGPLLWGIYGICYLIDNDTYIGVFWMSVLGYACTLYMCYRIFGLYLTRENAVCATFLLGLFYFNPRINSSTEAETFCQPFIASALYCFLRIYESIKGDSQFNRACAAMLGVCVAFPLLIKFTVSIMVAIFPAMIILYLVHLKRFSPLLPFVGYLTMGFLVIVLPTVAYLVSRGCFAAYVYESFIYTTQTVSMPLCDTLKMYIVEYIHVFSRGFSHPRLLFFIASLAPLFYSKDRILALFLMTGSLWFLSIAIHHDMGYYTNVCNIWCFSLILLIFHLMSRGCARVEKTWKSLFVYTTIVCVPFYIIYHNRPWNHVSFFTQSSNRVQYYECASYISQVHNAKMLNFKCYEFGLGTIANALPACKRYALPHGYLPSDVEEQIECLERKEADFVVCEPVDSIFVSQYGYTYYSSYIRTENTWNNHVKFLLFGRKGLKDRTGKINVNNMDVLLKRKVDVGC